MEPHRFAVVSFWTTADFNEPHAFRQSTKPGLAQIAFDLNSNEEVFTQTCWNSAAPIYFKKNYFHASLEATKSLSAKIRKKSGLTTDAAELAMNAFGLGRTDIPYLV